MNPAVVEVTIEPVSANQTAIHIRATAKEGLIKQGTSEKAIKKVLAAAGWES